MVVSRSGSFYGLLTTQQLSALTSSRIVGKKVIASQQRHALVGATGDNGVEDLHPVYTKAVTPKLV